MGERSSSVNRESRARGFTVWELMIVVTVMAAILTIAIPAFRNARMAGNQASVIAALRAVVNGNISFRSRFQGYAPSLIRLSQAGYIDNVIASGAKSGYTLNYTVSADQFTLNGDPIVPGTTGWRYFFTDQTGVIRFANTAPATASSPPIDG